jgi:hypothetical protein
MITPKTKPESKVLVYRRSITTLGIVLALAFLAYTTLVITTTISITSTKELSREAVVLQSEIADLEVAFLQQSQTLTLEYAQAQGFEVAEDITFARRTNQNGGLALRE